MSIDTISPRTRRSILFGAVGGALASVGLMARPAAVRAGVDGDLVLEAVNATTTTTELDATGATALKVVSDGTAVQAQGAIGVDASSHSIAVNAISDGASAPAVVGWNQGESVGILGWSTNGTQATPTVPAKTAILGVSEEDATSVAVLGQTDAGQGVRGTAAAGVGVHGEATSGRAVEAAADTGIGVVATSNSGPAIQGTSSAGIAIRGHGQLDGVVGESASGRSGVVGFSGGGSAPAGPGKTGVYGEATQDASSHGVYGYALAGQGVRGDATAGQGTYGSATTGQGARGEASGGGVGVFGQSNGVSGARGVMGKSDVGQAVRGEATTGIGVQAVATTGVALAVSGRATFSRSGKVNIGAASTSVDVTVPGGIASNAMAFAAMQYYRSGVYVAAARINYPTAGKLRIYLNKAPGSTTALAWFVFG